MPTEHKCATLLTETIDEMKATLEEWFRSIDQKINTATRHLARRAAYGAIHDHAAEHKEDEEFNEIMEELGDAIREYRWLEMIIEIMSSYHAGIMVEEILEQ